VKLAGKRFWTWVSVAVLSLFARGGSGAFAQEKPPTDKSAPTTQFKHSIPPGPHSKTGITSEGTTPPAKRVTKFRSSVTGANGEKGSRTGFKGASSPAVGEKRDLQTQGGFKSTSGFKTSTSKAGGDDTPTESSTKSKHHGVRKPK
jgi:hypothetical protein